MQTVRNMEWNRSNSIKSSGSGLALTKKSADITVAVRNLLRIYSFFNIIRQVCKKYIVTI
jgi:hypothetical protein